jgi:hypothetical protein
MNDYDDLNTNASSAYAKGIIPGKKASSWISFAPCSGARTQAGFIGPASASKDRKPEEL